MDKYYGNVCELDIIFNFQKAYFILDELLLAGEMQESSKKNVLRVIGAQDSLEDIEVSDLVVLQHFAAAYMMTVHLVSPPADSLPVRSRTMLSQRLAESALRTFLSNITSHPTSESLTWLTRALAEQMTDEMSGELLRQLKNAGLV